MTKEQVDAVISLGPEIIAAVAGTVTSSVAITKFFDYLKAKVAETSVGATKVAALQKAIEDVAHQVLTLKENDVRKEHKLDQLHNDNKEMINRIIDWMGK